MNERGPYREDFIKFIPYLNDIDITTRAYIKRIESIYELCCYMCPEKIEDILVEDYIKDDGTREYEDLNFFSKGYCLSAHQFLTKNNIHIGVLAKRIIGWRVQATDFDFKKATTKSRLNVSVRTLDDIEGEFKAARENCRHLQAIIDKYIKPNQVPL